jgi:predicted lipoprotein with Yx(FWY)xxD motif
MKKTSTMAVALIIGLTACGSDAATKAPVPAPAAAEPSATQPQAVAASFVTISDSSLGKIMTDANGMTLYGFTSDVDGTSTCDGGCASAWPPVIVDASFDVSTLPAEGGFSIVDRADGTKQLKAGKWPLYTFGGDTAAGDTNGQGSGSSWFVVTPDGSLIK